MGKRCILMHEGHPLAYISNTLGPRWQKLSIYEKKLLVAITVEKWELAGKNSQFMKNSQFIKADQKSLKWLLQPKVSTPCSISGYQSWWVFLIFVVLDRLSKYNHFMALTHPYPASQVVRVYLNNVYKLHGWPSSIGIPSSLATLESLIHNPGHWHGNFICTPSTNW